MSPTRRFSLNDSGVTLVEVLIVIAIFAMLVTALSAAMGVSNAAWRSGSAMSTVTKESEAGLMAISSKLRTASSVDLSNPSSPTITSQTQSGDYAYTFSLSGSTLRMHTLRPDGTSTTRDVALDISNMSVSMASTDSYNVDITSSTGGASRTASTRVTIRR